MRHFLLLFVCVLVANFAFAYKIVKAADGYHLTEVSAQDTAVINRFNKHLQSLQFYRTLLDQDQKYPDGIAFYTVNIIRYGTHDQEGKFKPFKVKKCFELVKLETLQSYRGIKDQDLSFFLTWKYFKTLTSFSPQNKQEQKTFTEHKRLIHAFEGYLDKVAG